MKVSIELFLIDNVLMDLLILYLTASILSVRPPVWKMLLGAFGGAIYALLSMTAAPFLATLVPKLALGCMMALPLTGSRKQYIRALVTLYLSAFLTGGLMLCITMLLGGGMTSGTLVGSVPVRAALIGILACACLPRVIRSFMILWQQRARKIPLRITFSDRTIVLLALIDTGNFLTEPLSGRQVILVQPTLCDTAEGRPVAYRTVNGTGLVYAVRPKCIEIDSGGWLTLDAYIAASPTQIDEADAIIGGALVPKERGEGYVESVARLARAVVSKTRPAAGERDVLHSLGRDASGTFSTGGGTDLGGKTHAGR